MSARPADAQLVDAVRARGGRVTSQRIVMLRYLKEQPRHVTAERLLAAVEPALPGLSLPTVYATLDLFEELGLVRRVVTAGGTLVFDSETTTHHHLVCRLCGVVRDLDVPIPTDAALAAAAATGFGPETASLTVTGLCGDCRAAAAPAAARDGF
jgi:Fe2+ or Zn2+ uptake regulation protein